MEQFLLVFRISIKDFNGPNCFYFEHNDRISKSALFLFLLNLSICDRFQDETSSRGEDLGKLSG